MQKKLIFQIARFGDIAQTRRLIKSLMFDIDGSKNEICLCVDKIYEKTAAFFYPDIEIIGLHAYNAQLSDVIHENRKIFASIKAKNFDEIYTLNYAQLTYSILKLFDEEKIRGYILSNSQESRSAWYDLSFKFMTNREQSPLHVSDHWAFLSDNPIKASEVNPSAEEKMLLWQEGKGEFEVAIILAGQDLRRSVPPKDLAMIVHILANRFDKVVFRLLGTAKEETLAREFYAHLPKNTASLVQNHVGKTSFIELLEIIKHCDLALSPDTGSLHAAAFFGVPTLSFFCSSAYCYETGAYGLGHLCIQASFPCVPCTEKKKCHYDIPMCHNQFSSPALYAWLAKQKTQKKMEYFGLLQSSFDEIGLTYTLLEGAEKQREYAYNLRKLLQEYRYGQAYLSHTNQTIDIATMLYEGIFTFLAKNKV